MAQWFRTHTAPEEDLSLIPRHQCPIASGDRFPSSGFLQHLHSGVQTYTDTWLKIKAFMVLFTTCILMATICTLPSRFSVCCVDVPSPQHCSAFLVNGTEFIWDSSFWVATSVSRFAGTFFTLSLTFPGAAKAPVSSGHLSLFVSFFILMSFLVWSFSPTHWRSNGKYLPLFSPRFLWLCFLCLAL